MEYTKKPYYVYIKTNSSGYITAVNSSAFLTDVTGWMQIDSGFGDKYHHAQGNYFPDCLTTATGVYRYKLVDGMPAECTKEEMSAQIQKENAPDISTLEKRICGLENGFKDIQKTLARFLSNAVS